ncbi:copper amine oxidase N-terminal domain-containing protein [Gorillibacterium sp. CAU 1737]|uniref:copper amine oxidase N-terminal domain-containing protein n=1 Tax=Gorillibacterium sp. CAU 1737 TaxID=3140362 RepID=UPI0032605CDA
MKKLFLTIALILLCCVLLTGFSYPRTATAPLIRLNDVYVMYTYPKAPYVNEQGRLMVPLRLFSEMIGAELSYTPSTKSAIVSRGGHRLEIREGGPTAYGDGEPIPLESSPVAVQGSLYVPLRFLMEGLHIPSRQEGSITVLEGDSFFKKGRYLYHDQLDWTGQGRTLDPLSIRPLDLSFQVETESSPITGTTSGTAFVRAQNVSGEAIEKGRQDLHVWIYQSQIMCMNDYESPRINSKEVRPARKKNEIFTEKISFTLQNPNDKVHVVLAVGRTLKTYEEAYR